MTVTTTTSKIALSGDGVTTVFTFTFQLQQAADLTVYVNSVLVTSGYTVQINSSGVGGTVTFAAAPSVPPTAGVPNIILARVIMVTQGLHIPTESNIPEQSLENAYDKLTLICQQLTTQLNQSLSLPLTAPANISLTLPLPQAGAFLGWDPTGTFIQNNNINLSGGGILGPTATVTGAIPLWGNTTGTQMGAGVAPVAAGNVLTDNGVGQLPTYQAVAGNYKTSTAGQALVSNGPASPPSYQNVTSGVLNPSNNRPLPTSGVISGDYYVGSAWTQTGAITATSVRIFAIAAMTFNNAFTVSTEAAGGSPATILTGSANIAGGSFGAGFGGGGSAGQSGVDQSGGGGGGFGGAGGSGASSVAATRLGNSGGSYPISMCLSGSGGGCGSTIGATVGSTGGAGGGSLYIETTAAIVFASGSTFNLNGAPGTAGAAGGGGGSGGGFQIRSSSTININAGAVLTANGGAGGNGTSVGGGGGGGGILDFSATSITNNGTVTANGGALGTTGGSGAAAIVGSAGVITANNFVQGPRRS